MVDDRLDVIDLGGGVRVALLGLLTDQPGVFASDTFRGVSIDGVYESAAYWTDRICEELEYEERSRYGGEGGGGDGSVMLSAVIPLTHQSVEDDERFARAMLSRRRGDSPPVNMPVVLGGHEHDLILRDVKVEGSTDAATRVIKTGSDATCACVVDVLLQGGEGVSAVATTTVDVQAMPVDSEMQSRTEMHNEGVSIMRNEVLIDRSVPWYARLLWDPPDLSSVGARRQQTTMGTIIASAIRAELGDEREEGAVDCCVINGGPIKGERDYPSGTVTYAQLAAELPFPTKMVAVPMQGRVLSRAISESRAIGAEERGYLQLCDQLETEEGDPRSLVSVGGAEFDPDRVYTVALPRNLMRGFCGIQPLVDLGAELSDVLDGDSYVPALNLVIAYFAKDLWRRIGRSFEQIDRDGDGVLSREELANAFARKHGRYPSKPLMNNLLAAFGLDGSEIEAEGQDGYEGGDRVGVGRRAWRRHIQRGQP